MESEIVRIEKKAEGAGRYHGVIVEPLVVGNEVRIVEAGTTCYIVNIAEFGSRGHALPPGYLAIGCCVEDYEDEDDEAGREPSVVIYAMPTCSCD